MRKGLGWGGGGGYYYYYYYCAFFFFAVGNRGGDAFSGGVLDMICERAKSTYLIVII